MRDVILLTALALGASLLFAAPASAKLVVKQSESFFPIRGRTPRAVYEAMDRYSIRHGQQTWWAMCEGHLSFKSEAIRGANGWRVTDFKTILKLQYTYPKWGSRHYSPPLVVAMWDEFAALLERHELTHGAIWLRHAKAFDDAVKRMPPAPSTKTLEAAINKLFATYMQRINTDNETWDRETTDPQQGASIFAKAITAFETKP